MASKAADRGRVMRRYVAERVLRAVGIPLVIGLLICAMGGPMGLVSYGSFDGRSPPREALANLAAYYGIDGVIEEPSWRHGAAYLSSVLVPRIARRQPASVVDEALVNIRLGKDRYLRWMNFGPTLWYRTHTVNDFIRSGLPISTQLGILSILTAFVFGLPLGLLAALKRGTLWDYLVGELVFYGISVPALALGPVLVVIFGLGLRWLPLSGWGTRPPYVLFFVPRNLFSAEFWGSAIMPCVTLGASCVAIIAQQTRDNLLQIIYKDGKDGEKKTAVVVYARGVMGREVEVGQVRKGVFFSAWALSGPVFARVLVGLLVVERVFGIPGLGNHFVAGIGDRDYPIVVGIVLLFTILVTFVNLLSVGSGGGVTASAPSERPPEKSRLIVGPRESEE
ncbi:MAG: hypothetical protein DRI48_06660 [Chloroflexi bacterium]|nr:MAG: hypothetical protein DRI48_06660 [Chloroflexota bacterium]